MKGPRKTVWRAIADTARRITGISTPLGGIQWSNAGRSQRECVRRLVIGLENRRALYKPMEWEDPRHVHRSAQIIRDECTRALQHLDEHEFGVPFVRAIREAGRRYQDDAMRDFPNIAVPVSTSPDHLAVARFFLALGALRTTIGYNVSVIAAHYKLDVDGNLASVLPRADQA